MSLPPRPNLESVTTINLDGSRRFIHPARVNGAFTTWRSIVGALLTIVYASLPWITINGNPAVFLDVTHLQFHFFGLTFVTQDLWLAFFLVSGLAFSLFYVAALFGRVWCGWGCPQTVFLDLARRIERWCEGDSPERVRLDSLPWTGRKTIKRLCKHVLFGLFAGILAHVFLSYFVSLPRLYQMMTHAPFENWTSFVVVGFITGVLWFDFAWFREQFCIVLCPYGRLQGALIDKHSVVIGYDEKRGEPRGKKQTPGVGDCVDCGRCVAVCPTGIDIRQGQQIECIGCAACVDACDDIMTKLRRAPGLVRYDSMEGFAGRPTKWIRPRTILYTALLLLGTGIMLASLSTLRSATVSVTRLRGAPYFLEAGQIRNQYLVRVLNKRNREETYRVEFVDAPAGLQVTGIQEPMIIPSLGEQMRPVVVTFPRSSFNHAFPVTVRIVDSGNDAITEKKVSFLGPFTP
jgi:cytochrome c oxidase accessory protein FixG